MKGFRQSLSISLILRLLCLLWLFSPPPHESSCAGAADGGLVGLQFKVEGLRSQHDFQLNGRRPPRFVRWRLENTGDTVWTNPVVIVNEKDFSSLDGILAHVKRTYRPETTEEWVKAMWTFIGENYTYSDPGPLFNQKTQLHHPLLYNPLFHFNSVDFSNCAGNSVKMKRFLDILGMTNRVISIGHVYNEAFYDSAWHVFDVAKRVFFLAPDNRTIAGKWEILNMDPVFFRARFPNNERTGWKGTYYDHMLVTSRAKQDEIMSRLEPDHYRWRLELRPGEILEVRHEAAGPHVHVSPGRMTDQYSSGTLISDLLASSHPEMYFESSFNIRLEGNDTRARMGVEDTAVAGEIISRIETPWHPVGGSIHLNGKLGANDEIEILWSDNGETFVPIRKKRIRTSDMGTDVSFSHLVNPRPVKTLLTTWWLKIRMTFKHRNSHVSELKYVTDFQVSRASLPELKPGRNIAEVRSESEGRGTFVLQVQEDFTPIRTAPTLLDPPEGARLSSLEAVFRWASDTLTEQTDPIVDYQIQFGDKRTFTMPISSNLDVMVNADLGSPSYFSNSYQVMEMNALEGWSAENGIRNVSVSDGVLRFRTTHVNPDISAFRSPCLIFPRTNQALFQWTPMHGDVIEVRMRVNKGKRGFFGPANNGESDWMKMILTKPIYPYLNRIYLSQNRFRLTEAGFDPDAMKTFDIVSITGERQTIGTDSIIAAIDTSLDVILTPSVANLDDLRVNGESVLEYASARHTYPTPLFRREFDIIADGAFHTYQIKLNPPADYVTNRLLFSPTDAVGADVEIDYIRITPGTVQWGFDRRLSAQYKAEGFTTVTGKNMFLFDPDRKYHWCVRGMTLNGDWTDWSEARSFSFDGREAETPHVFDHFLNDFENFVAYRNEFSLFLRREDFHMMERYFDRWWTRKPARPQYPGPEPASGSSSAPPEPYQYADMIGVAKINLYGAGAIYLSRSPYLDSDIVGGFIRMTSLLDEHDVELLQMKSECNRHAFHADTLSWSADISGPETIDSIALKLWGDVYRSVDVGLPGSSIVKTIRVRADNAFHRIQFYVHPRSLFTLYAYSGDQVLHDRLKSSLSFGWARVDIPNDGRIKSDIDFSANPKQGGRGIIISRPMKVYRRSPDRPPVIFVSIDALRVEELRPELAAVSELCKDARVFDGVQVSSTLPQALHISMVTGFNVHAKGLLGGGLQLHGRIFALDAMLELDGYITASISGPNNQMHNYLPTFQSSICIPQEAAELDQNSETHALQFLRESVEDAFFLFYHIASMPADRADRRLSVFLSELKKLGIYDDALIVVAGGAEGLRQDGESKVPLIVKLPGAGRRHPARRIGAPIRLADVTPTVLDYLRLPRLSYADGHTLMPLMIR